MVHQEAERLFLPFTSTDAQWLCVKKRWFCSVSCRGNIFKNMPSWLSKTRVSSPLDVGQIWLLQIFINGCYHPKPLFILRRWKWSMTTNEKNIWCTIQMWIWRKFEWRWWNFNGPPIHKFPRRNLLLLIKICSKVRFDGAQIKWGYFNNA